MGRAHCSPSWQWSPAMALPAQNVCMNTDVLSMMTFVFFLLARHSPSKPGLCSCFVRQFSPSRSKQVSFGLLAYRKRTQNVCICSAKLYIFLYKAKYLVSFLSILDKKMFYVWSFCFFLVILHMDNKLEYAIYSGGVDTCVPMDIYHPQAACAISSFGIYYKLRIYLPYCFSGRTTILPLHRWKEPSPLYGCAS